MGQSKSAFVTVQEDKASSSRSRFFLTYSDGSVVYEDILEEDARKLADNLNAYYEVDPEAATECARSLKDNVETACTELKEADEEGVEDFTTKLLSRFYPNELEAFKGHGKKGRRSLSAQETYDKRDAAVVELFLEISKDNPQTKRHCYYLCKAMSLCGSDTDRPLGVKDKIYHSNIIARIINDACWSGKIPWDRVLDDTRTLHQTSYWDNAQDRLQSAIKSFETDRTAGQNVGLILCCEKDAVVTATADLCHREHVAYMSFHGQVSDPNIYKLAKLIDSWKGKYARVEIAYLGDFDAGGLVIDSVVFRNWSECEEGQEVGKLHKMLAQWFPDAPPVCCTRIGITAEDLDNPTYERYLMEFDEDSENSYKKEFLKLRGSDLRILGIDILANEDINARVENFIAEYRNQTMWEKAGEFFDTEKAKLQTMSDSLSQ